MADNGYLVDTNIIRKSQPSEAVVEWLTSVPAGKLYVSVITIGEITKGIAKRRRSAGGRSTADDLNHGTRDC